jgi:hypothetical protein
VGAQFTKQSNYHILLSAFRPFTISKLKVQELNQKTLKYLIMDRLPKYTANLNICTYK